MKLTKRMAPTLQLCFGAREEASVLRYCKVARYDADLYYDMRMVKNMGGIGAHHDADYDTLKRFVEDPWMCKETMHVRCQERDFAGFEFLGEN